MNAGSGATIADDSGNSGTAADITGATWVVDTYYVDVYDNSTQTTGTFKVTQGNVEGKALTSLTYDGSSDNVDTDNENFFRIPESFGYPLRATRKWTGRRRPQHKYCDGFLR